MRFVVPSRHYTLISRGSACTKPTAVQSSEQCLCPGSTEVCYIIIHHSSQDNLRSRVRSKTGLSRPIKGNTQGVSTSRLPFTNRRQAGVELASSLLRHRDTDAIVLAIPRGGVVVAYEVAAALNLVLDVIVARKIGAPDQPELAIGAVASWGDHDFIVDEQSVRLLRVSQHYIETEAEAQIAETQRRIAVYRGTAQPPNVANHHIILIDDGIATGFTIRAAAMALHNLNVSSLTLAVPVAAKESLTALDPFVDELVCLETPDPFMAVGYWYQEFAQVSDQEVIRFLNTARHRPG